MIKIISNIADVNSGHHFKERIVDDPNGSIKFIQLKDIDDSIGINYSHLIRNNVPYIKHTQFLKQGDIIVKCRGNSFTSVVFDSILDNVVATSHFFVIRIKCPKEIIPEYLSWFINDGPSQRIINAGTGGTHMQVLNKKFLSNIEIRIPSIEIQQKIVKLKSLSKTEQILQAKRFDLRNLLIDHKLRNLINKG